MDPASRTQDYRVRSARCAALAQEAATPALQALWLEEARLWRMLEEQGAVFDRTVAAIEAAISEAVAEGDAAGPSPGF